VVTDIIIARLTENTTALPPSDVLALATFILSIPSIAATVIGVFISYRSFKQFQALCTLSAAYLPTENSDHFPTAHQSTILPIHRLPSRASFPYITAFDACAVRVHSAMSGRKKILCASLFQAKIVVRRPPHR
jgi:hypothetical protein